MLIGFHPIGGHLKGTEVMFINIPLKQGQFGGDLGDCQWIPFKWEKFGGDLDDDNWIPSKLETFWKGPWSF